MIPSINKQLLKKTCLLIFGALKVKAFVKRNGEIVHIRKILNGNAFGFATL